MRLPDFTIFFSEIGKISNDETVLSWTLGITGNKSGSERPQSLSARADFLISF